MAEKASILSKQNHTIIDNHSVTSFESNLHLIEQKQQQQQQRLDCSLSSNENSTSNGSYKV